MQRYEGQALDDAMDRLVTEMVRAEPDLLWEDAREVIGRTVGELMRDAGKVS